MLVKLFLEFLGVVCPYVWSWALHPSPAPLTTEHKIITKMGNAPGIPKESPLGGMLNDCDQFKLEGLKQKKLVY